MEKKDLIILLLVVIICLLFSNLIGCKKLLRKSKKNENFTITNGIETYDNPVSTITINNTSNFINKSWNKLIFDLNNKNIDNKTTKNYSLESINDYYITVNAGDFKFNNDGFYLIEIDGRTYDFRGSESFNKLLLSVGIGLFKNDKLLNDNWASCDNYGRCTFSISKNYVFSKDDVFSIKFIYLDNTDDFIKINNIKGDDIKKYKYEFNNGISNILIKITNLNLLNSQSNYIVNKINDKSSKVVQYYASYTDKDLYNINEIIRFIFPSVNLGGEHIKTSGDGIFSLKKGGVYKIYYNMGWTNNTGWYRLNIYDENLKKFHDYLNKNDNKIYFLNTNFTFDGIPSQWILDLTNYDKDYFKFSIRISVRDINNSYKKVNLKPSDLNIAIPNIQIEKLII